MPEEIIRKLPMMRISCGENDCLKDDSIRFLNKVLKSGH